MFLYGNISVRLGKTYEVDVKSFPVEKLIGVQHLTKVRNIKISDTFSLYLLLNFTPRR